MASSLKLHEILCEILGCRNVYFNPPESLKMQYPAIVYNRKSIDNLHANDAVYKQSVAYDLIVIDYDSESEIVDEVSKLPMCRFDRSYISDNLNHNVFTLYF